MRHYGLLANRQREIKLTLSRFLLHVEGVPEAFANSTPEVLEACEPHCPNCGSTRIVRHALPSFGPSCRHVTRCINSG